MKHALALVLFATACGPSANDSGCADKIGPGDLVITEVFADFNAPMGGTGADEGKEWFEIYNAADRPIELKGLVVTHSRPNGDSPKTHTVTDVTIAPGQFFTLGNATPDLVPAYIDYGYSADLGDFFNSDGGQLKLTCGDSEIDTAGYDTVKPGHSRELSSAQPPDYTFNDDLTHWCQGNDSEFETGNFGTPGGDNDCQPLVVGECSEGGNMRAVNSPMPGDLVITEVMPSPGKVSDTVGEWFEAKVLRDVDLNGLGLDRAGDTTKADVISDTGCISVTAGSYVVFAKSPDMTMNGGLPAGAVKGTFKFSMVAGSVASPGDVQIMAGTTVIDAITWTKSTSGKSLQLDPTLIDPVQNDQPSNFCDGTAAYGLGDLGTPQAVNTACTLLPPPGKCMDMTSGTQRDIVKPAAGQLVISEFLANPANITGFTDAQREWFEVTNTGATAFDLNGLGVSAKTGTPQVVASATCLSIAPAGFGLFARSSDPMVNAMLPPVDGTFSFSLVDTNGGISVFDGATLLDAITWMSVTSGVATQLGTAHLNATDNDTAANFCPATATYGDLSNKGTPRAANAACP